MASDLQAAAHRFEVYARDVIAPAMFPLAEPLRAEAFQCAEPVPYDTAVRGEYRPVEPGWQWGPVWSTAWFRLSGRVPETMAGRTVALRFSSGTEALLWADGRPRRGLDVNRDDVVLLDPAAGGEDVRLHVEAACNHPFGISVFDWDPPDIRLRWRSETPGRLERCELAVCDETVRRLHDTWEFARQLLAELSSDDLHAHRLAAALDHALRAIDDGDVAGTAGETLAVLEQALAAGAPAATRCLAVGHAHIDTAWLWPIRETKRKCLRTFANVLELMDTDPDFRFLCSQAQQYAWVERDAPDLFARIAARVREGRWEPSGAMWVEPDCNVPSGESLIRQILHGRRYFHDRFGDDAPQRLLYLPDTFGFPAALPQIAVQSGLDTFVTNKMSWSQTNEFPLVSFRWRGLDGTEILAHCTPGHDYNATNTPAELRRGERNTLRKDKGLTGVWLQPFGYGDGGGGPTAAMIRRARLAGSCPGLPGVRLASAQEFCDELHRARAALRATGSDLPVWDGELYLELHRGTYTTQSWLKQANRRAENDLRAAEWLALAGPAPLEPDVADRLDEAWTLTLLNQFHDILPGSSITMVYDDARRDHQRVSGICHDVIEQAVGVWSSQSDTSGLERPMIVLNPASTPRSAVVECEGELHYVAGVPALGATVVDRAGRSDVEPVRVDGDTLSNGIVEAVIDRSGRVVALRRDGHEARDLNRLVLYEDRPRSWEAWDIDAEYVCTPEPVDGDADQWRAVETGPLRAAIEVTRPLGRESRITQRFVLCAGSPRLDIETQIEWHESRRLLRAYFPVGVRARQATFETQFGHLQRPTHRNTTWEQAAFEVCAHTWMDLSEPGFGVALLNDARYGHSCEDDVMGLTLLRSTRLPDPRADVGGHRFTYSLMPHGGDWRAAGVDREAHALNTPMRAHPLAPGQSGGLREWAPVRLATDGAAGIVVSALKRAEDGDGLILRLVETHGGRGRVTIEWGLPVSAVEPVDLLERPMNAAGFTHAASTTSLQLRPFQIASLRVR